MIDLEKLLIRTMIVLGAALFGSISGLLFYITFIR